MGVQRKNPRMGPYKPNLPVVGEVVILEPTEVEVAEVSLVKLQWISWAPTTSSHTEPQIWCWGSACFL